MSVDRLVQKIKLGERGLIQKSMYQLILMMAENPNAQEEIMKRLPEEEILKMMTFLEDSDSTFRKLTAKFFLDLVYGNFAVQQVFCEILGILCCDGKVCLNKVPETSKNGGKYFPECIDVLKKVYSEELKETIPYCWFFSDEYNKYNEKQIEFIPESARRGLENIDNFVDPMYAMIGFVVRTSKVKKTGERRTEHREKNNVSKEYDNRRLNTTANIGGGVSSSSNTSFDYALQPRLLNDSKVHHEKDIFKSISPMAAHSNAINPCVYSSRINYPKTTKAKIDNSTVSQSVCSTERFAKLKFEAVSARNESVPYVNSTIRDPNNNPHRYIVEKDRIKLLNNTIDVNRFAATEGDFSLDTLEHLPTAQNLNHKMVASMNDSQEFSVKLLETSVDNSVVNNSRMVNQYGHLEISAEVSPFRGGSMNQSKLDATVVKQEKVQTVRNKHLELDKKYIANTFRDKNAYPLSASTTPKSSLLNKILKEKPLSKEINHASKSKSKQEQVKRLNVTAAPASSSSISGSKHVSPKYSANTIKTKVYNKYETDSNNKKYAFHNSLMKSMDVSNLSHHMGLIEERDELSKENYQHHDVSERVQTAKYENRNTKSYQSPAVFKSISTTPRTPADYFKSTITQNAKILNARKSHDTAYLFTAMRDTGRRNTEASIPLQTCKNKHAEPKSNYGKMCITEFSPEPNRPMTPKLFYK